MSSNNDNKNEEQQEVVLRDLQTILRKNMNENVIVINYTTSTLLPKGENYGSTMLKVDAVIKRERKIVEENLSMVAKMMPTLKFQATYFNGTASFVKEIYVFEKLIPAYMQLEKEVGIKNEDLFDILPKFYGGRLTRNENNTDKADEDAVLLMENLKLRQYYTMDRMHGLDLKHSKLAIAVLARFHALGTAMKLKKPALFREAKEPINYLPFNMEEFEMSDVNSHTFQTLCTDPRIAKYKDRLEVLKHQTWEVKELPDPVEPWISIIHGDYWVNNIMFQQENEQIKDIKIIDFQLAKVSNPLRDLPYFICGSVNPDIMDQHIDELLDIYYKKYIEVLDYIGCDTSPFTRESFDENLKLEAHPELFHCIIALKFFTINISEDTDINDLKASIMLTDGNSLFVERSLRIIRMFIKKGWL